MTIEEFCEKCKKRPMPKNPMAQARLFAREIAEGASYDLWNLRVELIYDEQIRSHEKVNVLEPIDDLQIQYFQTRWNDKHPNYDLLRTLGYLNSTFGITEKAFNLIEEIEQSIVFISYKRSESSAFALLVNNTLKQYGVEPFVDMQLQAGDDWHAELEENIKNSDYFIILLGNETLTSEVTVKEIRWAIEGDVTLIPIWHNGFIFNADDWLDLPVKVSQVLSSTHTIRVLEENPLTYDTALRELLNRFGIST